MTASVTTSTVICGALNRPEIKKACSSTTDDKSVVTINPFLNDFFDCIENLPNKLQILLSELRNVDSQVNARHRKLQLLKQAIFIKISISTTESTQPDQDTQQNAFESFTIEQLLHKLHQLLVQCQIFGDQKVKLTSQIMEILSSKTRQLGFDSLEHDFQLLNEEKIVKDFRMSIKKRSMHHHYNCSSSGVRNSSNRNTFSTNQLKNKNLSLDLTKYPKRVDQIDDLNSNNETNHYHTNSINNSLRNLNVINKTKQQIRHKTITNFQTNKNNVINKNKIVLNNKNTNNSNKKLRLELNSSNSNSPYLCSQLNAFKNDSTDDSAQNRPKRQLTDNNKTLTDITINKKRRLNQLKQTLNTSTDSNHCKSPSSTTSSYSSNNSKLNQSKRLSLKQDKLKKKYVTGKIIKNRPSNIVNNERLDKKKKETKRSSADNADLDSEEYENFNFDDNKTKLDLPSYDDHSKNSDPEVDRLSNETESINHIDNEDQDDIDDLSDNQLDEDDNESNNFDAESNIGDDEQEDDENRDEFDDDEDEDNDSDYKTIKKKPYPSSNEDDLNENSENQSWAFNQQTKSKTNRSKTLNSATTNTTTTSNTNTNSNVVNEEEQTYCICEQISYGQMICCDNKSCKIEWFHFNCVKLTSKPKGKWYCPNCRGDTHKVMKKPNNKHLTSSSVYYNNNSNSGYLSSSYRAK